MKTRNYLFMLAMMIGNIANAQYGNFTNKLWRVNEFYVDSARAQSGTVDSLRYYFNDNGTLLIKRLEQHASNVVPFDYNPTAHSLNVTIQNEGSVQYHVVYFDAMNLILVQDVAASPQPSRVEYRMIPDHP